MKFRVGGSLASAALFAAAFALLASCSRRGGEADNASDSALQAVGGYRLGVTNTPSTPQTGDNTLSIELRDAAGKPVRGASVEALVSMAAMGAMPRMESRGKVKEAKPGRYLAEYGLAMNGEWDVDVHVRTSGGTALEAAYRLSTSTPGLAFVSGTPATGQAPTAGAAAEASATPGEIRIDAARRQEIGIRTAPVEVRDLSTVVRTVGRVTYDETRLSEVTLKYSGYVRELRADFTGRPVRAGEVLFTAYSPELWSAQQEYLEALHPGGTSSMPMNGQPESDMAVAARRRLELWDLTPADIQRIAREGKPREALPVVAPVSGVVTEKNIVRGSAFTAGQVLFKIAPLDPAWIVASVYQVDLPLLKVGMAASLTNPYLEEAARHGRVAFIAPSLSAETRSGEARIEVPNPHGTLKPGMFVDVALAASLGRRLAVPESAVLPTGERRIVFVDLGDGRLAPREVRLGARAGDYFEVLSGLEAGDLVVTSGNFLVAAESKLKSAELKW